MRRVIAFLLIGGVLAGCAQPGTVDDETVSAAPVVPRALPAMVFEPTGAWSDDAWFASIHTTVCGSLASWVCGQDLLVVGRNGEVLYAVANQGLMDPSQSECGLPLVLEARWPLPGACPTIVYHARITEASNLESRPWSEIVEVLAPALDAATDEWHGVGEDCGGRSFTLEHAGRNITASWGCGVPMETPAWVQARIDVVRDLTGARPR